MTLYFDLELARTHIIHNELGLLENKFFPAASLEENKIVKCQYRLGRDGIKFYKSDSLLAATVNH